MSSRLASSASHPRLALHPRPPKREITPRATQAAPGVVDQVRSALRPRARLATLLGAMLGGFVPVASYVVAHREIDASALLAVHSLIGFALVAGGLLFSAKKVYGWGRLAFQAGGEAVGFTLLMEGVMVFCNTTWLSVAALVYLVGINAISTGCTLSLSGRSR